MSKKQNKFELLSDGKIGLLIESATYGSKLCIIDKRDAERVLAYRWSIHLKSKTFYCVRKNGSQHIQLHRFILNITDPKIQVDHRNGNGLDCRRSNLRKATKSQNCWNRGKYHCNTSGYKGVFAFKDLWTAKIRLKGKLMHLGYFKDPILAYKAYCLAARKYHGEFASLI